MKLACQLAFKQTLYVHFINIISHYLNIFRAQSILLKLKTITKINQTTTLYDYLINMSLQFLSFWNLVSIT